jgi:lipid A 3-O-deacylase
MFKPITASGAPGLRPLILILTVLSLAAGWSPAAVAAAAWPTDRGEFTLHFENDVLGTDDSDRHYTNGLQFAWQRSGAGLGRGLEDRLRRGPFFAADSALLGRWALGHSIFTPENIKTSELVPEDRPYAAWLHLDYAVLGMSEGTLDILEVSVGMVGPAAGGEQVQKWFHDLIDSPDPQGWHNQVGNEPALLIAYGRRWRNLMQPRRAPLLGGLGLQMDLAPHLEVALGNVYTYGGGGMTLRLGSGLAADFGPPRIRPAPPAASFRLPGQQPGAYVFAGLTGRAMLQNIFLDGNTFKDSHRVDREILVGDWHWGLVISGMGMRLAFSYVVRSPEFVQQQEPDHFGTVTFSAAL